jgi:ABC-2 type transport system permease protein
MKIYLIIAKATIKMYFRRSQSLFWALFFPIVMMVGLGFSGFGEYKEPKLGIVDRSNNSVSIKFLEELNKKDYLEIKNIDFKDIEKNLIEQKLDSILVIPENFGEDNLKLKIVYQDSKENLGQAFKDFSSVVLRELHQNNSENKFNIELEKKVFSNENQGYKGFLVPGIVALSIMQSGILGVVFTLISFKTQGILRRLQATPISSRHFLIGQLMSRLLIILIQTFVLFFIGILLLNIDIALGNIFAWINIIIFSILGSILFLLIGLTISGASPNEDYAAPIANLVTFPMMVLSGVFFDASVLPGWLNSITSYLPLTPLVTSLRESALYGTNTIELLPELLIMCIWILLAFFIGVKTFKWE